MSQENVDVVRRSVEAFPDLEEMLSYVHPEGELHSAIVGGAEGNIYRGPDGFLLTYGHAVRPRARLPRGSLVDITPTLLYFFGLPVARDMDGYARADLFTQEFTAERPITFIPSYR